MISKRLLDECAYSMFHGHNKEPHPFHINSNWEPPIQPLVALETYLKEVKTQLVEVKILKPRNNLPHRERQAIKELEQKTNININKADKGTKLSSWIKTKYERDRYYWTKEKTTSP